MLWRELSRHVIFICYQTITECTICMSLYLFCHWHVHVNISVYASMSWVFWLVSCCSKVQAACMLITGNNFHHNRYWHAEYTEIKQTYTVDCGLVMTLQDVMCVWIQYMSYKRLPSVKRMDFFAIMLPELLSYCHDAKWRWNIMTQQLLLVVLLLYICGKPWPLHVAT